MDSDTYSQATFAVQAAKLSLLSLETVEETNHHTAASHRHVAVPQMNFQTRRGLLKSMVLHGAQFSLLARANLSQELPKARVLQLRAVRRISEHTHRKQLSPIPEFWSQNSKASCLEQPNQQAPLTKRELLLYQTLLPYSWQVGFAALPVLS